jgi:glycosyltransferase involved in cell wall biosynthesis
MTQPIYLLTTTYNSSDYIDGLITSIEKQTDHNYFWIVVDNESIDNTLFKINRSSIKNKKIIVSKTSIYEGINACIAEVGDSGYYLTVGSDDTLSFDCIKLIRELVSNQDLLLFPVYINGLVKNPKRNNPFNRVFGWQRIISSHSVGTVINVNLHKKFGFYSAREFPILADGYFLAKVLFNNPDIEYGERPIGTFSTVGTSNKNIFRNIFSTFEIQSKYSSIYIQIIFLIYRLIKYRHKLAP